MPVLEADPQLDQEVHGTPPTHPCLAARGAAAALPARPPTMGFMDGATGPGHAYQRLLSIPGGRRPWASRLRATGPTGAPGPGSAATARDYPNAHAAPLRARATDIPRKVAPVLQPRLSLPGYFAGCAQTG